MVVAPVLLAALVGAGAAGVVSAVAGGTGVTGAISAPAASGAALRSVPAGMLALYEEAATTCPGLSWAVLAAIGTVESSNGTSDLPGVHAGANEAGAEGPMQFEPATFAAYERPVPPGGANPPSPYDPTDAVYAAARYLCANGAGRPADLAAAVFAYNHSDAYVAEVLSLAATYGQAQAPTVAATLTALHWALAQAGTPYVWGGETPGVGFDCSGLVQAAYRAAGINLPRTAQGQFDAGPRLSPGTPLRAGDLVFFGSSPTAVDHVGIFDRMRDGAALMVDAPHTGADVGVEPFPTAIGAPFGDLIYLGATRPGRR